MLLCLSFAMEAHSDHVRREKKVVFTKETNFLPSNSVTQPITFQSVQTFTRFCNPVKDKNNIGFILCIVYSAASLNQILDFGQFENEELPKVTILAIKIVQNQNLGNLRQLKITKIEKSIANGNFVIIERTCLYKLKRHFVYEPIRYLAEA